MKAGKLPVILITVLTLGMTAGCGTASQKVSTGSAVSSKTDSETVSDKTASSAVSTGSATEPASVSGTSSDASRVSYTLKIDSSDGTMEIMAPDNWADMTGQMDTTGDASQNWTIEAGCLEEEAFLTANSESRTQTSLASLAEYSDTIVQAVSSNTAFTDVTTDATEDLKLTASGFAAKKTKISATYSGHGISYWIYAVEGSDRYYQFAAWTASENAAAEEVKFDAIVNSFTVLG